MEGLEREESTKQRLEKQHGAESKNLDPIDQSVSIQNQSPPLPSRRLSSCSRAADAIVGFAAEQQDSAAIRQQFGSNSAMGNANVSARPSKAHDQSIASPAQRQSSPSPGPAHHRDGDSGRLIDYSDSMLQSPPDSPSSVSRSPLMFTPQMPMLPIARGGEFSLGSYHADVYGHPDFGRGLQAQERGVPTMISWSHGGNSVAVEGSWDNWATRQQMQKVGKDFTLVKMLPSGVYQYKIILDKGWHYPDEVLAQVVNVLDVQDYVPENLDSVAGFEPPGSPTSSYNDSFPSPEDFSKEPPGLPSHLHLTLLNVPTNEDTSGLLPRPQHVTLNHLYAEKGKNLRSVLALGLTHRYRSKYVTLALYKPVLK